MKHVLDNSNQQSVDVGRETSTARATNWTMKAKLERKNLPSRKNDKFGQRGISIFLSSTWNQEANQTNEVKCPDGKMMRTPCGCLKDIVCQ